jgi:hypothetical protein
LHITSPPSANQLIYFRTQIAKGFLTFFME